MSATTAEALRDRETLTDVKSEQIRILFAAVPSSLLSILLCSLVLCLVQWPVIDAVTLVAWFCGTNLLSVARYCFYRQFRRSDHGLTVAGHWYRLAIVTSGASGLSWGIGGFLLFPEHSPVHQMFLALVVAGISAGAITTLAAIVDASRAFVLLALLPVLVKINLLDNELTLAMTGLALLFMIMILVSAQRLNQTIVESLEVRLARELAEQKVRYQAQFDALTDLPNRRLLLSTLRQEIAKAERHRRFGAVLFVDLDRFKAINDSLGHAVGDDLLVQVAVSISARLREEDTVGRLGGDEFVVLLPEVGEDEEAAGSHALKIADDIRLRFKQPFDIQGHEIHLTISIGVALYPCGVTADDLLKYADVAMYEAKNAGRDAIRLFSRDMQEAVNRQREIEKGLRDALARAEFELYLQPQYDSWRRVIGAETLLRWNHPVHGVTTPGQFIEVAELTGLIVPIGEWILRSACAHLERLPRALKLAVNVSPRQFGDPDFVAEFERILAATGADPARLKFEITEGLAMANLEHTIATMQRLRQLGVSFSIDDFGTGYSSLNYLHRLPVDELKIDQSFVRDVSERGENAVIVDTIIVMAQQLRLAVVAEGIESEAEFDYLRARRCDRFQGYYFSHPLPFDRFLAEI